MNWCWFSLSAFTVCPCPFSIVAPWHALFPPSHFYVSVLQLALSHHLISLVVTLCLSPVLHFSPHTCPLLYRSFFCVCVMTSQSLCRCFPLLLSVPLRCENDFDGWLIRWFVCMCVWGSDNDGMLRDRWKVRHRVQTEAWVCHLLSALFNTGCVITVSFAAQNGIIQYLQPKIIRGLQSATTVSLRTLALLITCQMFGFILTWIFRGFLRMICSSSES